MDYPPGSYIVGCGGFPSRQPPCGYNLLCNFLLLQSATNSWNSIMLHAIILISGVFFASTHQLVFSSIHLFFLLQAAGVSLITGDEFALTCCSRVQVSQLQTLVCHWHVLRNIRGCGFVCHAKRDHILLRHSSAGVPKFSVVLITAPMQAMERYRYSRSSGGRRVFEYRKWWPS